MTNIERVDLFLKKHSQNLFDNRFSIDVSMIMNNKQDIIIRKDDNLAIISIFDGDEQIHFSFERDINSWDKTLDPSFIPDVLSSLNFPIHKCEKLMGILHSCFFEYNIFEAQKNNTSHIRKLSDFIDSVVLNSPKPIVKDDIKKLIKISQLKFSSIELFMDDNGNIRYDIEISYYGLFELTINIFNDDNFKLTIGNETHIFSDYSFVDHLNSYIKKSLYLKISDGIFEEIDIVLEEDFDIVTLNNIIDVYLMSKI